jgi:hypothetical protein
MNLSHQLLALAYGGGSGPGSLQAMGHPSTRQHDLRCDSLGDSSLQSQPHHIGVLAPLDPALPQEA